MRNAGIVHETPPGKHLTNAPNICFKCYSVLSPLPANTQLFTVTESFFTQMCWPR